MNPLLPLGRRLAGPILFLLTLAGAVAAAEFWMRRQLPRRPPASEKARQGQTVSKRTDASRTVQSATRRRSARTGPRSRDTGEEARSGAAELPRLRPKRLASRGGPEKRRGQSAS